MRRAAIVAALVLSSALQLVVAMPARAASLDAAEVDLVSRINSFRAANGLARLSVSDTITAAAKWMATDMAVRDYFSHTSLDGRNPTQRMADAGYPAFATWTGEDLAAGYSTAGDALDGWLGSPSHYAVLTNPNYRAIGVARAYGSGSTYKWYWVADFGGIVDSAAVASTFDPGYHSAWAGQSADPVLAPGQITTLVVALRNSGYRGWYAGVPGQEARLGTSEPLDAERGDVAWDWVTPSRPGTTTTSYVGPGQVGWFQFQVRAPATRGVYRLALRGVIDGTTWLEDQGIFFTITVR